MKMKILKIQFNNMSKITQYQQAVKHKTSHEAIYSLIKAQKGFKRKLEVYIDYMLYAPSVTYNLLAKINKVKPQSIKNWIDELDVCRDLIFAEFNPKQDLSRLNKLVESKKEKQTKKRLEKTLKKMYD